MAKDSKIIEGPAGYVGGMTPNGAEKMPTKHYPETTKMGTKSGKVSIDGPCKEK